MAWLAVAGALAAAAVLGAYAFHLRPPPRAEVMAPPESPRQPAAIRAHLRETYAAARQAPESPAAVGAYCLALHADMFHAAADQCYASAIDLEPDEWRWPYYRALVRSDLGDAGHLAGMLRAVVDMDAGFAPAWLRLGDAEFKAGRYTEAEQAWTRVLQLPEPERPSATVTRAIEVPAASYATLGIARIRLLRGDAQGALETVTRLADTDPPFSSAYRLMGQILTAGNRANEADRALARARRLPPFAPYADPMVDRLALESRNSTFLLRVASEANLAVNGAWSEYLTRRALTFDPDNPEVVMKLARVLRTIGRSEEALDYFKRYQALVPGDVQVLAHLGSCLSELGRFAEAEPLLRRAAAELDDALTHYNLALLLSVTGRVDEAVLEYERALQRDPSDVTARSNLAAALVRRGELDRAAQELTRVLELDPENAIAHTNLGLVLSQRGDVGRARHAFEEALRLDPGLTHAAEALRALDGR